MKLGGKMPYCVGGHWQISQTQKYMPVSDSSTGEVIAEVPCCTKAEVEEAIEAAHRAFPAWSGTPVIQAGAADVSFPGNSGRSIWKN